MKKLLLLSVAILFSSLTHAQVIVSGVTKNINVGQIVFKPFNDVSEGILYNYASGVKTLVKTHENAFKTYPNPVRDDLFLTKQEKYEVFDIYGRRLTHGDASKIDMRRFSKGIYFVKTQRFGNYKILKQ